MAILRRVSKTTGKVSYQVLVDREDPSGKRKRVVVGTFKTKKEAEREERDALAKLDHGGFVDPSKLTLQEAIETWLEVKRPEVRPNSHYEYRIAAELHIYPTLGKVAIQKLTHPQLQAQVSKWTEGGMSASLTRRCVSVLKQTLDMARKGNLIHANPADGLKQPSKVMKKDLEAWDAGEMNRFLAASEKDYYSPLWHVLLLEGCRRGEALGLRWQDLDLEAGTARIVQTVIPDVTNHGRATIQARTKTDASTRTIHLTTATAMRLRQHRDAVRFTYKASGREWKPSDLVFQTSKGTPVNPSSVKRNLGIIIKAAGVRATATEDEDSRTISVHDLRHMAATRMLAAHVPLPIVSLKLGHSSPLITASVYAHLLTEDQKAASMAMDALLNEEAMASNA